MTRRSFTALIGAAAATAALPSATANADERPFRSIPQAADAPRPNVLVILGDDLGWADLSSYGSPDIKTPNLDALAARGVRFTNGYASSSTCSPTRLALYTGRYPGRLKAGLNEPLTEQNEDEGLPPRHPTLASLLGDAGYTTAMYGKWHCGQLPKFSPIKSGWNEFVGSFGGAVDYYSKVNRLGEHDFYEDETPIEDLDYFTDTITARTIEFLQRDHTRPWLLNLNYTAPHWPWEAPGDTAVSEELTARAKSGEQTAMLHHDGGSLDTYRKMVESLDSAIGRVLAALRTTGQIDNTLILFTVDNGGERFSHQWPLVGEKYSLNEGGIRVPAILSWPAAVGAMQVSDVPVVSHDWTATILDVAGARPDPDYPLDGHSMTGYLLRGEAPPQRDLFWRTEEQRALRRGSWKYFRSGSNATSDALFDLATDQREQADLSEKRPEILKALRSSWEEINEDLLPY